jgi:hypothetical protein
MTKSILDQLDEAEKAATPGPWVSDVQSVTVSYNLPSPYQHNVAFGSTPKHAELIALMRNNIRALIDVAKAAEALKENIGRTIELREEWRYNPKNTISSAASVIVDLNVLSDFVEALAKLDGGEA